MTEKDPRHFTGRVVHDPLSVERAESRREYIQDTINGFVEELPPGDNGTAPNVIPFTQPEATTCFYAALGGITAAISSRTVDVNNIAARARSEGLLGPYGAETFPDFQEQQTTFVRQNFGINIRFIDQLLDKERLDALTRDLVGGQPVVFGLPHHWVALDGIRKNQSDQIVSTWTGMNPYPNGRRIENQPADNLTALRVIERLVKPDMPIVVVENSSASRFIGRGVRTANGPRFRSAAKKSPKFRPARRLKRIN